jgi:hypothetical protein
MDDWGWIRDAEGMIAATARGQNDDDEKTLDDHRRDGTDPYGANAAFIVRAVNSHDALVAALDNIFSRISYINIHGVGEQPEPDHDGNPQPMRVSLESFHAIWKEMADVAAAALSLAEA